MVLLYVSFTLADCESWSKSRNGRHSRSRSWYAYGSDMVAPWRMHRWGL
jgi:hypothetical protein